MKNYIKSSKIGFFNKDLLFYFKNVNIGDNESLLFYQFLSNCVSLKKLTLMEKNAELDFKELYLSLKNKDLTKLNLCDLIECKNIDYYKNFLSLQIKNLRFADIKNDSILNLPIFQYLNENIINLFLISSIRNLEGVKEYLEKNQMIEKLEFIENELDKSMFIHLSKGISKNNSLKHLILKYIKELDISLSILMDGMMLNRSIEIIEFIYTDLKDESCQIIASYLSNHPLKVIDLTGNKITEKGVKILNQSLMNHQHLKSLILSENPIKDSSCLILRDLLKSNTKLQTLKINDCNIKEEGIIHILEGLQFNKTLTN